MTDVVAIRPELEERVHAAAAGALALAHLLACLDNAVRELDECGLDVDARVVEAHVAALRRGKEWPGDPIESPELG